MTSMILPNFSCPPSVPGIAGRLFSILQEIFYTTHYTKNKSYKAIHPRLTKRKGGEEVINQRGTPEHD